MNKKKFLQKILNNQKNIGYNDFVSLIEAFGFCRARSEGSHTIFKNPNVNEIINLQNVNGEAKPYQIKQFLQLIEKYNLELED
ncbi:type II toxin-antitoxin system HicA family toxin [Oscillospiraceae bacterium OttesenSCG-928-F05]|nr:type II toxin-antitoxin system HicA family toxin [Oscillospiraceae bacterium OttesenSCG-928-F05]